ncbi:MAG: phosphate ABC transporter substrate-binding protein PstS [Gemmatimonadaceae bacterium]|nr:phosphate ABC transporter substrate-binding protein PstS [Acetobacteraceae bacterium]
MSFVSKMLATAALGCAMAFPAVMSASAQSITGAGASFPNPLYQKWGEGAKAVGITLNYQSVGSGAGQTQIKNRTVDFGASDSPMTDAALKEANLLQFPAVMGAVVAIVNIPGVGDNQMKLTGEMLADIYLGKITKWNDPKLVEMNRGVSLPNLAIAPVYRADGSGTTFVWVSYLSAVSPEFREKVGVGNSVRFPSGTGARGNEGIASTVRNTRGGIGYVENAYATVNKLTSTQLRNKAGNFVSPSAETFIAAAQNANWSTPNFAASIIDQQGANSWPIVSPTFILLPKDSKDAARTAGVMKFFDWSFTNGEGLAKELEYMPLPAAVQQSVRAAWAAEVKGPNGQAISYK